MVKVKAHLGIEGNEKADELAKLGSIKKYAVDNRWEYSSNRIKFFPNFMDLPIDTKFKKFIIQIFNTLTCGEWKRLKHHRNIFYNNMQHDIN
jgi:hypothetical protein